MAQVELDLDMFEGRDLALNVYWFNEDGESINISGYGAAFGISGGAGRDSKPLILLRDGDGITVGGADGKFSIRVPAAKTINLNFKTRDWELVVWPTSATPEVNPVQLAFGLIRYRPTFITLADL